VFDPSICEDKSLIINLSPPLDVVDDPKTFAIGID
tara:strand:- start:1098 stop:1202 length:105 start_codon:yes stop_codon:yes gene_type:complete